MRNLILTLTTAALVGWLAAAASAADPDGPGPEGPPPSMGPDQPHRPRHAPTPPGPHRRGGRGPFGYQHVPPMFRDLTDKQIEEILAFVREKMPWRYERLKDLRESHPDAFRRLCRRLRFEIDQLQRLEKTNREAYEAALKEGRLRNDAADLVPRIRQTHSPDEKKRLVAELRDVLGRLFDAERKAREAQIHELEKRISQLRRQLADRAENRDRAIDHMLKWMLSTPQDTEDEEGPPPPTGP